MTRDDTGRAFWPAHLPGTKARLSAGHGTGQNPTGSRPKGGPPTANTTTPCAPPPTEACG